MKKIALLLGAVLALFSCSKENEKVLPGVFVKQTMVETFPGDQFVLTGTASNYVGLASITVSAPDLGIEQTLELKDAPKVYPFRFDVQIPEDAGFKEAQLNVEVTDIDGRTAVRPVLLKYIEDTVAPTLKQKLDKFANLEITEDAVSAVYDMAVEFTDERALAEMKVEIPEINFSETLPCTGKTGSYSHHFEFAETGVYHLTLTVKDASGNELKSEVTITVTFKETEYEIKDYEKMYFVISSETEADYFLGYYQTMKRAAEFVYTVNLRIPEGGAELKFTAEESMEKNVWGVSPQNPNKILNNKDYVLPLKVTEAGYKTLTIDIKNHSYTIEAFDVSGVTSYSTMTVYGEGWKNIKDWTSSPVMTKEGDHFHHITLNVTKDQRTQLAFLDTTTKIQWKSWNGLQWYKASAGDNFKFWPKADAEVTVTFDTAVWQSTIKKN